jgi:uncharacterized protein (DUF362 family)
VFRLTIAAMTACILLPRLDAEDAADAPPPPRPPAARLAPSTIWFAHSDDAIEQFAENATVTRRMVDRLVMDATGQTTVAGAWRTLVSPGDRVGIKVATAGAPYCASHRGVVEAVIAGLESAGVARKRIIVWDRDPETLRDAGYSTRAGFPVRAIDPPHGYDREATFTAPVLGKLIWGDLLFREKVRRPDGKRALESDQLSSLSHLATILSREVTKIVNVPVLTEDAGCGVAGALYNMTVPNVDNWRRFLQLDASTTESIASLYADERIAPKVVLHIMDALVAQYAGGPRFQPNYAVAHRTLYVSRDPVALDANGLRKLEEWRRSAKLTPIAKRADWLESAEQLGLGNFAADRITLTPSGR